MPYREHPDAVFNPEIHEHVKPHKKTKGGETWVRKTAVESDKRAEKTAELRNMVKEPNWFEKLFRVGEGKKDTAMDVLTEEGLEAELGGFHTFFPEFHSADSEIRVTINGHKIMFSEPYNWGRNAYVGLEYLEARKSVRCTIDGAAVEQADAMKIMKKIFPLLKQARKNQDSSGALKQRLETKRSVLEVLGKTSNQNLLKESPETKQLPPHIKNEGGDKEK